MTRKFPFAGRMMHFSAVQVHGRAWAACLPWLRIVLRIIALTGGAQDRDLMGCARLLDGRSAGDKFIA